MKWACVLCGVGEIPAPLLFFRQGKPTEEGRFVPPPRADLAEQGKVHEEENSGEIVKRRRFKKVSI